MDSGSPGDGEVGGEDGGGGGLQGKEGGGGGGGGSLITQCVGLMQTLKSKLTLVIPNDDETQMLLLRLQEGQVHWCLAMGCQAACSMEQCLHRCSSEDHFHNDRVLVKSEHICHMAHSCGVQGGMCRSGGIGKGRCIDKEGNMLAEGVLGKCNLVIGPGNRSHTEHCSCLSVFHADTKEVLARHDAEHKNLDPALMQGVSFNTVRQHFDTTKLVRCNKACDRFGCMGKCIIAVRARADNDDVASDSDHHVHTCEREHCMGVCGRDPHCRRPCRKGHTHTVEEFVAFQPHRDASAPSGVGHGIYATRLSSREVTELSLPAPDVGAVAKAFALERLLGTRHDSFSAICRAADAHNRTDRVPPRRIHTARVCELEDSSCIDPFAILASSMSSSPWGSRSEPQGGVLPAEPFLPDAGARIHLTRGGGGGKTTSGTAGLAELAGFEVYIYIIYVYTYTHTRVYAYMHACMHTHTHTHTYTHTYIRKNIHTYTHTYTHTRTYVKTYTRTHTHIHTHVHT